MNRQILDALSHLIRARDYADDLDEDVWRFALEWRSLRVGGLEASDVRWLFAKQLIELKREISLPGAFVRTFIPHDVVRLTRDTALILTDAGVTFCRSVLGCANDNPTKPIHCRAPSPANASPVKPTWNKDRKELAFAGQVVKLFRKPAINQELILTAFEEEGWPDFILDPLPQSGEVDRRDRLQSSIKSLNRHQSNHLIRFRGNGGNRIFWCVHT
ncbi:hypothetical protein [Anatilimnocola aggregata]|nr:hypothetical protein [Anatilimnocola aggregata]